MTCNTLPNSNTSSIISVMDQQTRAGRIFILERIRDQKHILFGRFTDSLKKHDKEKAWNKIAQDAISLGHFPPNRHGGYLRDTTWQNWRKRFVEKRDKKLEYERLGGGKKIEFDDADLLIADILGDKGANGTSSSVSYHSNQNQNHHRWVHVLDTSNNSSHQSGGGGGLINSAASTSSSGSMFAHNFLEVGVQEDDMSQYYHNEGEESADVAEAYVDEDGEIYEQEEGDDDTNNYHDTGSRLPPNSNEEDIEDDNEAVIIDMKPPVMSRPDRNRSHHYQNQGDAGLGGPATSVHLTNGSQNQQRKRRWHSNGDEERLEDNGDYHDAASSMREALVDKKLRLEVDLLEMEGYKKRLEILKLERHLGLPPSAITRKVLRKS